MHFCVLHENCVPVSSDSNRMNALLCMKTWLSVVSIPGKKSALNFSLGDDISMAKIHKSLTQG